jgi:peptidoglycan/xylan/chitin deacetylase (PgdA/CDA1 family)
MATPPRVAILTYHSLDTSASVLSTSPEAFAEQMRLLAASGVQVLHLVHLPRVLGGAASAGPAVVITFDDGFRSVYDHGLPVLARYGFPATVFLVTGHCGLSHAWAGRTSGVAGAPLLGWREIAAMAKAGISFGSHTETHSDLRRLDGPQVEHEMVRSKQTIEDALGFPVETFAYPYGAYDARVKELARTHFAVACSTTLDFATPASDLLALERLDMYYFRRPEWLSRLFSVRTRAYVRLRRMARAGRRWLSIPAR